MRKLLAVFVIALLGGFLGSRVPTVSAQVPNNPYQLGVSTATHTACTLVSGATQYCFAADGLWVSISGAAYVQVQTGTSTSAVTSVQVCPLTGTCTTTAQTGAVVVKVPQTAPAVTLQ